MKTINLLMDTLVNLGMEKVEDLVENALLPDNIDSKSITQRKVVAQQQAMRLYRQEASRKASLANKRLKRLEERGLTDSPAYKAIMEGSGKFGVRGKDFNQVQAEMARLNKFINATTSTVRGINKHLEEIATITGMEYKNVKELQSKAPKFFELSSKVEQYLRMMEDSASAIGYQKIWEAINVYTQETGASLDQAGDNLDSMIELISKQLMQEATTPDHDEEDNWFKLD